jgi:hypothetical protein
MFRFYILEDEDKNLIIHDISRKHDRFPTKIDSFHITVTSPKIPNGVVSNLDALEYMRVHRIDDEVYKITPLSLGLTAEQQIPDGIYHFRMLVNNSIVKELECVVTTNIKDKIEALVKTVDTEIDINDNQFFIENLPLDHNDSKVYYIIAVYFKLVVTIGTTQDTAAVNDLIDKLQRLLTIVT